MIVFKSWRGKEFLRKSGNYTYQFHHYYEGYFLFGIIPLYIVRYER